MGAIIHTCHHEYTAKEVSKHIKLCVQTQSKYNISGINLRKVCANPIILQQGIFAAYRSLSQSKLKETIGLEYTINGS